MVKLCLPNDRYQATEKLPNNNYEKCIVYRGKEAKTKNPVLVWKLNKPTDSELSVIQKRVFCLYFLAVKETFKNENGANFLITASPENGSLSEFLRSDGPLSESLIRTFMNQLLEVADYLQRQQLAHICLDNDNIFVEKTVDPETLLESVQLKISPFGLIKHECKFCREQEIKQNDSCYTTDYCKHVRDLALSLLMIQLSLLRGKRRIQILSEQSEAAQDDYRRETEALANELMLKAFCGNVEYSVDSDVKFPFKSLQAFKLHHFSPCSLSRSSIASDFSDTNEKSIASAPIAPLGTQQLPPTFQKAPSEVFQARTPSRAADSTKNGIARSAASLKSAKSVKSIRSAKSVKSNKSGFNDGSRWPVPQIPVEQKISRVTEYGRFTYEEYGQKITFEFTNGTGIVQGVCTVEYTDKQRVKLFKPLKTGQTLPSQNEDFVTHPEKPLKEFESFSKLDSTAICLYHMICNDIEAFMSHTAAFVLRSPFAIPGVLGIVMHSGDVQLIFTEHNSTYFRKVNTTEVVPKNGSLELGSEQLEVFEAVSFLLEAHRTAWQQFPFIRTLKTDLTCYLSPMTPLYPLPHPSFVVLQPDGSVDEQYRESLEEFNRWEGILSYGNQMPSTSRSNVTY